jgi:membrane glycosyltransferase
MSALPPPAPQQAKIIWFAITAFAVAGVLGLLAGLVWATGRVLQLLAPVLWPLALLAGVLVLAALPAVAAYRRRERLTAVAGERA